MGSLLIRTDEEFLAMLDKKRKGEEKSAYIRRLVTEDGEKPVYIQPKDKGEKASYDSVVKEGEQNTPSGDKWKEDPYWKRILALREKAGRPLSLDEEMTETIMPKDEWDAMRAKRSKSLSEAD